MAYGSPWVCVWFRLRSNPTTSMNLVSDSQWEVIRTELPPQPFRDLGGRPPVDNRKCFEGILWILSKEASWNELPEEYGARSTVNRRFLYWISTGAWERLFRVFIAEQTSTTERSFWLEISEKLRLSRKRSSRPYMIRRLPYKITKVDARDVGTANAIK
jgi:transposase